MKRLTALTLIAAVILCSCGQNTTSAETTAAIAPEPETTAAAETTVPAETTTASETTTPAETAAETTALEIVRLSKDDYGPVLPTPCEANDDEKLRAEIKELIPEIYDFKNFIIAGFCYAGEKYRGEVYHENESENCEYAYSEVIGIADAEELMQLCCHYLTENYISGLEVSLEDYLFSDRATVSDDIGELNNVPFFKTVDGKLLGLGCYMGVIPHLNLDDMSIWFYDGAVLKCSFSATAVSYEDFEILDFILIKTDEGWKLDNFSGKNANYLGKILADIISEENLKKLNKICGGAHFILSDGEKQRLFEDDKFYCETDMTMTPDEMRAFVRSMFTERIAAMFDVYIDNYIMRNGKIYYIDRNSNSKAFGSYDYENSSNLEGSYSPDGSNETGFYIPWDDGSGEYKEIYIKLINYKYIDSELPSSFIGAKN